MQIQIAEETLVMLPERALFWPRTRTLFIADPHLPRGDLGQLTRAVVQSGAEKLIILGDLLHATPTPAVIDTVKDWRQRHESLAVYLLRGERDRALGDLLAAWHMTGLDGPTNGPYFVLNHDPITPKVGFALTGALHPVTEVAGQQVPCFWLGARRAVLPAFADGSGTAVQAEPGDRLFAITAGGLVGV